MRTKTYCVLYIYLYQLIPMYPLVYLTKIDFFVMTNSCVKVYLFAQISCCSAHLIFALEHKKRKKQLKRHTNDIKTFVSRALCCIIMNIRTFIEWWMFSWEYQLVFFPFHILCVCVYFWLWFYFSFFRFYQWLSIHFMTFGHSQTIHTQPRTCWCVECFEIS